MHGIFLFSRKISENASQLGTDFYKNALQESTWTNWSVNIADEDLVSLSLGMFFFFYNESTKNYKNIGMFLLIWEIKIAH